MAWRPIAERIKPFPFKLASKLVLRDDDEVKDIVSQFKDCHEKSQHLAGEITSLENELENLRQENRFLTEEINRLSNED